MDVIRSRGTNGLSDGIMKPSCQRKFKDM